MRTFFGILLLILGIPLLVAGGAAAVYVGSDNTVGLVDEEISSDAAVITSGPALMDVTGPTIHVTADAGGSGTFVGAAHPVHVDSYLDGVTVERIGTVEWRGELSSETVAADAAEPQAPPAELDWWSEQRAGAGAQSIAVELTDEPLQLVVAGAEFEAPLTVQLVVEAEVDGLFVTLLIVAVAGLILVVAGLLLIRRGRRRKKTARGGETTDSGPAEAATEDAGDEITEPTPLRPRDGTLPRLAVTAGLGALVLTGCAELPDDADHASHSTVPAITPEAADEVFANYTEVNNTANAEQDPELISTVETGSLLTSSEMSYEIQEAQDRDPIEPFEVTPEVVAAPAFDSYPMWFVARTAPVDADSGPAYYLFTRQDATSAWLATLSVYSPAESDEVELVPSGGTAAVAGGELTARGEDVLASLVEYAETGSEPDNIDFSQAGGLNSLDESGLEIVEGPEDPVTVDRECSLTDDELHWLDTGTGAVALAAVTCTQDVTLEEGYSLTLDEEGYGTLPGETHLTEMVITHGVSIVVSLNDDGSATVVGDSMLPYAMSHTEQ